MRSKYMLVGLVGMMAGVLLSSVVVVLAGDMDSPAGPTDPASQMYTLEQIYNRVTTGAAATKMTAFTEPGSGPGGTMHTLDQIMEALKTTHTRVPKTGQIASYATGDDGEYQLGVLPEQAPTGGGSPTGAYTVYGWAGTRFTDNGDGTVSDNLTGLIWLKNANCDETKTWGSALIWANGLYDGCANCGGTDNDCGLSDGSGAGEWRMPNINELHSLIDLTQGNPALPFGHPFRGVQPWVYLSSTSRAAGGVWLLGLINGNVAHDSKTLPLYVWPVRGGQ